MDSATAVALGLSAAGTASAAWALVYTRVQAQSSVQAIEQADRARREQAEPFVIVDIRQRASHSPLLVLHIENSGPTLARDVKIEITPPLQTSLGAEKEAVLARVLAQQIPSLPPGRKYMYIFDVGFGVFKGGRPTKYTARVNCRGPFGPVEELTYVIDLDVLRDATWDSESTAASLAKVASSVEKILDAQKSQSRSLERIKEQASRGRPNVEDGP